MNEKYKDNQFRPAITRREMELSFSDPTADEVIAKLDLELARKRLAQRAANNAKTK